MLTAETLPRVQQVLQDAGLDGWLLFDFRGVNPIASGLLRLEGMVTRRIFAYLPARGTPVAITHNIEQGAWRRWPEGWTRERYSAWTELAALLAKHVHGKRVAMEYSPGDAVPYVDRIPAGVLDLVRDAGATVVPSSELITQFYAVLTAGEIASHERAAHVVAELGRAAIQRAGDQAQRGAPLAEHELQRWIMEQFAQRGFTVEEDHPPIVAMGANAANPHYGPSADRPVSITSGGLLLVDLWTKEPGGGVYADQTWMGAIGEPSDRARTVWSAVRDARDAAIALVRERALRQEPLRGAEVDDAARQVIVARGFGDRFVHRTGHSIDARDLHGAGPHLDNYETREERLLLPGVAFSIEPGVYITGEIGVRSEVNAVFGAGEAIITPREYQRDLLVV